MPSKKPLHPMAAELIGLGARALDAGLRAFADTLLEAGENAADNAAAGVRRGRAKLKPEQVVVEGEGRSKKKPKRGSTETEEE